MDLQKFLRAVEEFIYEIALWPALIAKTVLHFTLRPERVHEYVTLELEKADDARYDEYMSPALFWLLIGFTPCFAVAELFAKQSGPSLHDSYFKASFEYRFATGLIYLLILPLTYAVGNLVLRREKITRQSLRHPLYVQLMAQAPFFLVAVLLVVFGYKHGVLPGVRPTGPSDNRQVWSTVFWAGYILLITSAIYVQAALIRIEKVLSWGLAILQVFLTYFGLLAIAIPLQLLAFAVFTEGSIQGK